MVADEPDRGEDDVPVPLRRQSLEHGPGVRLEPRLGEMPRALPREVPLAGAQPQAPRQRLSGPTQLVGIWVAGLQDLPREAVRREDHLHLQGGREPLQHLGEVLMQGLEVLQVLAPAPHQRELEPPAGGLDQPLLVSADRQRRIVGGHRHGDDAPMAVAHDALHRVLDERMPVPHADVHREPQRLGEGRGLRGCPAPQRRAAADLRVMAADLGHQLRARRAAAADVEQVGLDVVQRFRPAIGHQDDRVRLTRHGPAPPRRRRRRARFRGRRRGRG